MSVPQGSRYCKRSVSCNNLPNCLKPLARDCNIVIFRQLIQYVDYPYVCVCCYFRVLETILDTLLLVI